MPIYIVVPLLIGILWSLQTFVVKKLVPDPSKIAQTPLTASIVQSTLLLVFLTWIWIIPCILILISAVSYLVVHHLCFLVSFGVCCHSAYKVQVTNPGFIPKANSQQEAFEFISSLAETDQLDARHYCVTCNIQRPIRSKHCKNSDRCVAKVVAC